MKNNLYYVLAGFVWYFIIVPLCSRYIIKIERSNVDIADPFELLPFFMCWLLSPVIIPVIITYKMATIDKEK